MTTPCYPRAMRPVSSSGLFCLFAPLVALGAVGIGCSSSSSNTSGALPGPTGGTVASYDIDGYLYAMELTADNEVTHEFTAAVSPMGKGSASCSTEVGGCRVRLKPKCETACQTGEVCRFDPSCRPVCAADCRQCAAGELCFVENGVSVCKSQLSAGKLEAKGGVVSLAMREPYKDWSGEGPLLPRPNTTGADPTMTLSGSGGKVLGAFSAAVPVPGELGSVLRDLSPSALAKGPLALEWPAPAGAAPSEKDLFRLVDISVSTARGSVICRADDNGAFTVPDAALSAVRNSDGGTMVVTVERAALQNVYPPLLTAGQGDLPLNATARMTLGVGRHESRRFTVCAATKTACDDACVDLRSDSANCGKCGTACEGVCKDGKCDTGQRPAPTDPPAPGQTCVQCASSRAPTACGDAFAECRQTPGCERAISCVVACTTRACVENCLPTDAPSRDALLNLGACTCEVACKTQCGQAAFCRF